MHRSGSVPTKRDATKDFEHAIPVARIAQWTEDDILDEKLTEHTNPVASNRQLTEDDISDDETTEHDIRVDGITQSTYNIPVGKSDLDKQTTQLTSGDFKLLQRRRDPTNPKYLTVSEGGVLLAMYSAFWDDRETLQSEPVIRIISVIRTARHAWSDVEQDVLSRLRCVTVCREDFQVEVTPVRETRELQAHTPALQVDRRQIICLPLRCRDYVTVAFDPLQSMEEVTETWAAKYMLPVETYDKPETSQNLVVCAGPLFKTFDPYRVVEWFEMVKLLGVDKVVMYNESLDETASKVLRYYQSQGYLDVYQIDPHYFGPNFTMTRWVNPIAISDCMYRNMYRFKRLLGMDIDEFIIPRTTRTLPQFIDQLDSKEVWTNGTVRRVNFSFVSTFFLPNYTDTERFTHLKHNYRFDHFEKWHKKTIINPLGCLAMMNHFCHEKIPGFEKGMKHRSEIVDTELGFVHHYRMSLAKKRFPWPVIRDDVLLRYEPQLSDQVQPKLKELGLW